MNSKVLLISLLVAVLIMAPVVSMTWAAKADSKAKKAIDKALKNEVKKKYSEYCTVRVTTKSSITINNFSKKIYSKECIPAVPDNKSPIAKIAVQSTAKPGDTVAVSASGSSDSDGKIVSYEWSGASFTNDTAASTSFVMSNLTSVTVGLKVTDDKGATGSVSVVVKNSVIPACPAGQHRDPSGVCVPDIQPSNCVLGAPSDSIVRVGVTADTKVDGKEFKLAADCQSDILVVAGDLWYSGSSSSWFNAVEDLGFTAANTHLACGNHDSCSVINKWLGADKNWDSRYFADGKIQIATIDANGNFGCSSTQANDVKASLENSDAWYKLVVVHQPFATVKSDHGPNGQFSCYHTLFKDNGVDVVLQGHNHNYQHIDIDGVDYTVGAPGTHDTGSGLYGCDSTTFEGQAMECIRKNGVLFLDIPIDSQGTISGKAVDLSNKVFASFTN